MRGLDKLGAGKFIPDSWISEVEGYSRWELNSKQNLNQYIKDMTGAQMGEKEAERLKAALPNDENSPREYLAKLTELELFVRAGQLRYEAMLNTGIGNHDDPTGPVNNQVMPKMTDRQFAKFGTIEMGVIGKWEKQALAGEEKRRRRKDQFGISSAE